MRWTGIVCWSDWPAFWMALPLLVLTIGCTSLEDPPEGGQCPPLPYPEKKKRCDAAFMDCLDSPIQSIPSKRFGHSQCHPCWDLCMQSNGLWPEKALGKPCR
jgi:hypothetical protein